MKKKLILILAFIFVFFTGYFVGDAAAVQKANKVIDKKNEDIAKLKEAYGIMKVVANDRENELKETKANNFKTDVVAEWKEVKVFEGESIKDTESFKINSEEWRINWSTTPGELEDMNFQIYVYDKDKNLVGVAANVVGKSEDVSYQRGNGEYYLSINSAQEYKIIVEEK